MKTVFKNLSIIVFSAAVFAACNTEGPCILAKGSIMSETRTAEYFENIDLSLPAEVYVTEDSTLETPQIIVEAPENVLEYIRTAVKGKTLDIDSRKCFKNNLDIVIHISMPKLSGASINGSGNITGQTPFHTDNLSLDINGSGNLAFEVYATAKISAEIGGSGDIDVWGTANTLSAYVNGSGNIKAKELTAEIGKVKINGSGDCSLFVNQSLSIEINGSGDVFYGGDPDTVDININGSGKVHKE